MSHTTLPKRPEMLEAAANDLLPPAEQAKADAEHGSTGWSAYDVWRTRVLAPQESGAKNGPKIGSNDPRGTS
jgi:hypothetical protein